MKTHRLSPVAFVSVLLLSPVRVSAEDRHARTLRPPSASPSASRRASRSPLLDRYFAEARVADSERDAERARSAAQRYLWVARLGLEESGGDRLGAVRRLLLKYEPKTEVPAPPKPPKRQRRRARKSRRALAAKAPARTNSGKRVEALRRRAAEAEAGGRLDEALRLYRLVQRAAPAPDVEQRIEALKREVE